MIDQEMLAALTRLGFEIENGGISAYAEVSVIIGDDMDFRLQMVTDNGARVILRRVARDQILSFAKAVDPKTTRSWAWSIARTSSQRRDAAASDRNAAMKNVEDLIKQRFHKPDGNCLWCGRPADQDYPVGPITITKSEPDDFDDIWAHEFCCWECLALWFAEQAGGVFVGSQDGLT